jgi:6-phosphogluconolactonase
VRLIIEPDAKAAARRAASEIAGACEGALEERNRALIALSGGRTPGSMVDMLRKHTLPWHDVYVAQVDERIVPAGDERRNLTQLERLLVREGPLPRENLLDMPVETADPEAAARGYEATLLAIGGRGFRLDLVQLGLGADGHTASLIPGDPVLEIDDRDVAVSREYQGTQRMTLTCPALSRARARLWLVTGPEKADALRMLIDGDADIPANRVERLGALVVADRAAAPGLSPS